MYSLVHTHSGVEGFYALEGEACLETPTRGHKLRKRDTLAIPGGIPMRIVATGSTVRRVIGVIVHDATQPATMPMDEETAPQLVSCK
jgi:quercetin dioxygenase-like cupin family protein